ncbi:hypothetical protein BDQ17DRAFT_1287677 [Cyathus striatus]|nr:hypothetical protein BDQ17DRAFT_1287677 [Cyathus striatus]
MQQALINMKSLSKFTWQISLSDDSKPPSGIALPGAHLYPTVQQQRSLFETLRNSKTLTSLNVNIDSTSDLAELIIPRYPLWHIGVGNLTFLKLTYFAGRDGEVTKAIGLNIINMLQRNSLLQQLYIQYNSEHAAYFKSLRFPYLQKLGFGPLDERDSEGHDDFLSFIYAHRSLEDLMWNIDYNCSGIQLDFLPRLKSFSSNSDLIIKTMWGNAQCNLEQIYAISLTTETLIALRRISFPCRLFVKNIQFSPCDSPDLVEQAVLLFPNITVLMAFCLRAQYSLEQLITTLSELPFIEEVHVEGICDLIRALPNHEKRTFFLRLGNTCPRLRRLGGHPNGFSLIRDGEEVTWKSIRL